MRKTLIKGGSIITMDPAVSDLATGDLLISAIAPQASASSVPSKILSYLCAGRAVLAVVPVASGA